MQVEEREFAQNVVCKVPYAALPLSTCSLFSGSNEINFLTWMFFGLPTAVVAVVLTWVWLALVYCDDV